MQENLHSRPTSNLSASPKKTFKDVIRHFSPAWFAVNMGTSVISSLFHSYPYGHPKIMNAFALMFFFFNLILFAAFLVLSIACFAIFPPIWGMMLRHPVQSLYLSCFPMGADTLITVGVVVVSQYWGLDNPIFIYVLWGFWWLDVILSFLCCFGLVYVMATRQNFSMSTLTPMWILPIVTLIVCSSTGQLLAAVLMKVNVPHALLAMTVSLVMVLIGVSAALMILTIYLFRIVTDGFPNIHMIISSFLPLGPCGQAGYSLLLAGQNFQTAMPWGTGNVLGDELSGRILNVICLSSAFLLWCLGLWWLLLALIAVGDALLRGLKTPFKLAFWGLVFPNGVQALLTVQLGVALDATAFRMLGSIYGAAVLLIWVMLAVPTFTQVLDRSIFDNNLMQVTGGVYTDGHDYKPPT